MSDSESQSNRSPDQSRRISLFVFALIFVVGIFLRITPGAFSPGAALHFLAPLHPQPAWTNTGFDEGLYVRYANAISEEGLLAYPGIVEGYIEAQKEKKGSILPPVRFLFIFTGYLWHSLFGTKMLDGFHQVASLFSVLTLALATLFAWRLRGSTWATAIAALVAFAPTQLHM